MKYDAENRIAEIVAGAEEFQAPVMPSAGSIKPRLHVESCNPHLTVAALRDIFAREGTLYDRGVPVRLTADRRLDCVVAHPLTADSVVMIAHSICRPFVMRTGKDDILKAADARLPRSIAVMYLDWVREWQLPLLQGIASTPLLRDDGSIYSAPGYDKATGYWLENVPDIAPLIPVRPTAADAERALRCLRDTFATFCFADAQTTRVPDIDTELVDTNSKPGADESAFLAAVLTIARTGDLTGLCEGSHPFEIVRFFAAARLVRRHVADLHVVDHALPQHAHRLRHGITPVNWNCTERAILADGALKFEERDVHGSMSQIGCCTKPLSL